MKALLELVDKLLYLIDAHEELHGVSQAPSRELSALLEALAEEAVGMAASIRADLSAREVDATLAARREQLLQHALEAIAHGRLDDAETRLEAALKEFPDHHEYYNHLGLIAWERDDMKHAELYYARAATLCLEQMGAIDLGWAEGHNRGYLRALEGRALCLYRVGRFDEARELFETLAHTCVPDYQGCHYLAGEIAHLQGDHAGAIARYELAPGEPSALYNLALALFQAHRLKDAALYFIRAFALNAHVCQALLGRELDGCSGEGGAMQSYLAGPVYAAEFAEVCAALWRDEQGAKAFMARIYDDPHVRRRMIEQERCLELTVESIEALDQALSQEESLQIHALAERVLERIMY